jgi:hypothetical protein
MERVYMFVLGSILFVTALQREWSSRVDILFLCVHSNFYSLELVFAT